MEGKGMTREQAIRTIEGCGAEIMRGTPDEVRERAMGDCHAAAIAELSGVIDFDGEPVFDAAEWEPTEADLEYVEAQVLASQPEAVTYRFNADHLGSEWGGTSADGYALAEQMTALAEERGVPVVFEWAPGELCTSDECERYQPQIDAIWQDAVDASARELWS